MSIKASTLASNYAPMTYREDTGGLGVIELPILKVAEKDPSWREQALCAKEDINLFFSTGGWRNAVKVCELCVVKGRCLEFSIENEIDHGVWGGLTAKQRKELQ